MGSLKKPKKRMEKNILEIPEMQSLLNRTIELRDSICGFPMENPEQYAISGERPGRRKCWEINLKTSFKDSVCYYYTEDLIKSIKNSSPFVLIFPSKDEMDMFYDMSNELLGEIYTRYKLEYGKLISTTIESILQLKDQDGKIYEEAIEGFLEDIEERITEERMMQYSIQVSYDHGNGDGE